MAVKKLTTGNDNWVGTAGADDIDALSGDDKLNGGLGNDILFGNTGNDVINGETGNDTLNGGDDADIVDGGIGDDIVKGGNGDDIVVGDAGNDSLFGEAGKDVLDGGIGNDNLDGGLDNDIGYGSTGIDTLKGKEGNDYLSGGDDADTLFGGIGSDYLEGGDGNDILSDTDSTTVYGALSTEKDSMVGGLGNDTFYGGYDYMSGNEGKDIFNIKNQGIVYGGVDDDVITVTNTNPALASWLDGGQGNDKITAGAGNDTLFSGYGSDILTGGNGNDNYVMTFDNMADQIIETATGGKDTVYFIRDFKDDGRDDDKGADGKELDPSTTPAYDFSVELADNIENGVLDDQVYIFNPNQVNYTIAWLTGNALHNSLKGSNLDDILNGAGGNDTINAGDGDDIIFTGLGIDKIDGEAGRDLLVSSINFNLSSIGAGGSTAVGIEDIDLLDNPNAINAAGNNGNNHIIGNKFNNIMTGFDGDDTLDGWFYSPFYAPVTDTASKVTGDDRLIGGYGNDLYRIDSADDEIKEDAFVFGVDTVEFKGVVDNSSYTMTDGVENLKVIDNLIEVNGNNMNNRITGDSSANILKGGFGDDYLDGGSGLDTFEGGYGNDTFVVDDTDEVIKEIAGQGSDWVLSSKISLDLATSNKWIGVENAKLTGTSNLNVTGREGNNRLIGNDGANILDGQKGIDTLEGGKGNDTYVVDSTTDKLVEVSNEQATSGKIKDGFIDTVQSSVTFSLSALSDFENLSLTGETVINGTGNSNDNEIRGNDSDNVLTGLGGDDVLNGAKGLDKLIGGDGDDLYQLSNDGDTIVELANGGIDTIDIALTFSLLEASLNNNVENLVLSGTGAFNGTGNNSDNVLTGNAAANTLTGLAGADKLISKDGADILIGGAGADTIDLTEAASSKDIVRYNAGDSTASLTGADKIIKFSNAIDTIDLAGTVKLAANATSINGTDVGFVKSHRVDKGIIKFDDLDTFASEMSVSATNIENVIDYLKTNITNQSSVAFKSGSDMWLFQDGGATDTLITLVGNSATGLSTTTFSSSTIHIE